MKLNASNQLPEAPSQAAGYAFQQRYALLAALKRLRRDPTGSVGVEHLDDVVMDGKSGKKTFGQLKHTVIPDKEFTDSSPPIWRAIANWAKMLSTLNLNLAGTEFFLVTNAGVDPASGLAKISAEHEKRDRDFAGALAALKKAAHSSANQASAKDRAAFLALADQNQMDLIQAITFVHSSPNLAALGTEIEDVLRYACQVNKIVEFRLQLEGWWGDRVSKHLASGRGAIIPLLEIDARIDYLRERYRIDALEFDEPAPSSLPGELDGYLFVKQVQALKVGKRRVANAQRDFLRASAQRSKWLREARIDPAELNAYDSELEAQWITKFAILEDELTSGSTDDEKCKCGRDLLGWAELQQLPIRGARAQFLTSGSFHALADAARVGWHPEFKKLFGDEDAG